MKKLWHRLILVTLIAVAMYAAFSIYADVGKLGDRMSRFAPGAIVAALALALGNYVLRFGRWHVYLGIVGVKAPLPTSALVFVAGFAMSVTPGKVGELLKALLLKEAAGSDPARVAPVVVAERLTDLLALVLLGIAGVAAYGVALPVVAVAAGITLAGVIVLTWRRAAHAVIALVAKIPRLGRIAPRLLESYDHLGKLVRPGHLVWATLVGVVAWLCECLGFALIVAAFPGADVPMGLATLIYAVTTVAGVVSPGGLLVTESSMTLLLVTAGKGLDQAAAVAATILTRLCTLWFAVLLGLIALLVLRRLKPRTDVVVETLASR